MLVKEKPLGTLQVDVDSIPHLLRFYGIESRQEGIDNLIYQRGLSRFRELCRQMDIKMTFMVVGEDLLDEKNREIIAGLHQEGHEIANHSMNHCYGFSNLTIDEKKKQIDEADRLITDTIGERPKGFKAPGWDIDEETIGILEEINYQYDSSVFPSSFNLLMKLTHRILNKDNSINGGLGRPKYCLAPGYPYFPHKKCLWRKAAERSIIEIPTTMTPIIKIPFYSTISILTGPIFFKFCLNLLQKRPCNFVFHAIDLMEPEELDPKVLRHPGASLPLSEKWKLCVFFIKELKAKYRLVTSADLAKVMTTRGSRLNIGS